MAPVADIYESVRSDISAMLRAAPDVALEITVPATPDWTVKDVAAHLAADATCVVAGDFPRAFFESFGSPEGVVVLNEWTDRQIRERRGMPLEDHLAEWEKSSITLTAMMRGETPWPEDLLFADRIILTDAVVHQNDLCGALGLEPDKGSVGVKLAASGYIATFGWRLQDSGAGCLRFEAEDKVWTVGGDEPEATVRASRWEFFRALSGRRNPDQIRAYEWDGDPEPFIGYFYPYGPREDALHE